MVRAGLPLHRSPAANYRQTVKRMWLFIVIGIVLALLGLVWMLQGFGVIGGSAMSGSALWATIGPIVLIVGVVLIVIGIVRGRRGAAR